MPFTTKRQVLSLAADEKRRLEGLRRSRIGEKREVLHAGILLDLAGGMSDGAAARSSGVNRIRWLYVRANFFSSDWKPRWAWQN